MARTNLKDSSRSNSRVEHVPAPSEPAIVPPRRSLRTRTQISTMQSRIGKLNLPQTTALNPVHVEEYVPVVRRQPKRKVARGKRRTSEEIVRSMSKILKSRNMERISKHQGSDLNELLNAESGSTAQLEVAHTSAEVLSVAVEVPPVPAHGPTAPVEVHPAVVPAPVVVSSSVEVSTALAEVPPSPVEVLLASVEVPPPAKRPSSTEEHVVVASRKVFYKRGAVKKITPLSTTRKKMVAHRILDECDLHSSPERDVELNAGLGMQSGVANVHSSNYEVNKDLHEVPKKSDEVNPRPAEAFLNAGVKVGRKKMVAHRVLHECDLVSSPECDVELNVGSEMQSGTVNVDSSPYEVTKDMHEVPHKSDEVHPKLGEDFLNSAVKVAMQFASDVHLKDFQLPEAKNDDAEATPNTEDVSDIWNQTLSQSPHCKAKKKKLDPVLNVKQVKKSKTTSFETGKGKGKVILKGMQCKDTSSRNLKIRTRSSLSKDLDPASVDDCLGKVVRKFAEEKGSFSKKGVGKKVGGKRRVEFSPAVDKKSEKKAKIGMADAVVDDISKFKTTCMVSKFVEVLDELKPSQIEAVEQIGFGGLLRFRIKHVPKDLVQILIKNFNSTAQVQAVGRDKYSLDKNDIFDMFQLPISDKAVIEVSHKGLGKAASANDNSIRFRWLQKYAIKDGIITVKDLYTAIPNLLREDEMAEFKRVFVMFALACFLAPIARSTADLQIVSSLEDVDQIPTFDWCGFVWKRFCGSVYRVQHSQKFNSVNACLIIPLLAFFYRYPVPGFSDSIDLPLHQHWDTENVKERCHLYHRGGYTGFLRSSRQFPLSKNGVLVGGVSIKKNLSSIAGASSSKSSKRRFIELELPAGVEDDEEIERTAKSPLEVAMKKFKRLVSIASEQFAESFYKIGEKGTEIGSQKVKETCSQKTSVAVPEFEMLPDDYFSISALSQMDAMIKDVFEKKAKSAVDAAASDIPSFDLFRFINNSQNDDGIL